MLENSRTVVMRDAARAVARGMAGSNPFGGRPEGARADMESTFPQKRPGTLSMTAMTATTLGTVMLVVGVLVLAWGFPNLPRR